MDILKLQKKIVPELLELLQKRYSILRSIKYNQPVGRRVLANNLALGERTIRNEVNFLKSQELINIYNEGMYITKEGEEIINSLQDFIHEVKGLNDKEKNIKSYLNIKDVYIVPGDYEKDSSILKEVGRVAALYLRDILSDKLTIALTGGNTVKEVVDSMPKTNKCNDLLVIPARGGMGRDVEIQANTLAAKLAEKISANYKLLHVPDNLSDNALKTMLEEKSIQEVVDSIKNSDVLIYGIGRADVMGKKRELSQDTIEEILTKGAVGEALGNYYDIHGNIIYKHSTVGITDEDTKKMKSLIAVASNKDKAEAIIGSLKDKTKAVLVTDEGTAEKILNIIEKKEDNKLR
ncbi:sugar-binding domain-containing protein [Hathewaya limosa]|uniref:Central glycolytic genes regulator n=2 Tax=Hathewaya limosa TaxID=1536 RepID=A0ABU0JU69_HATLI|nr:central glycolytic genes regulator [Hathewaya limosa]